LKKLGKQKKSLNRDILHKIVVELTTRICSKLKKEGIKWSPMTIDEALNGAECDAFLRKINCTTAGGYGWPGKKEKYAPVVNEDGKREILDDLKQRVLHMLEEYKAGKVNHVVYSASLKDEPRETSKVEKGKTRLFWMSPMCALIVSRMFLSPFYTSEVQFGELFATCVGVNMHMDSDALYKELTEFSMLMMEGDFGNFDQMMPCDIAWAANSIIYEVSKRMGFNEEALQILRGILTDNIFPYGAVNLDMFCSPGQEMSGKYGTAEENGLRNLIMAMYYFYTKTAELGLNYNFFDFVLMKTYGDDLLASVKPEVAQFMNNIDYSKFVAEEYGMEYTSASKSLEFTPFVDVEDMTFLKRKFVFHDVLGRYVAPLDMNSICRSLRWYIPSNFVSEADQIMQTVNSALRELFFHLDQKQWVGMRDDLIKAYCENYNADYTVVCNSVPPYGIVLKSLCPDLMVILEEEINYGLFDRSGDVCVSAQSGNAETICGLCELSHLNEYRNNMVCD